MQTKIFYRFGDNEDAMIGKPGNLGTTPKQLKHTLPHRRVSKFRVGKLHRAEMAWRSFGDAIA